MNTTLIFDVYMSFYKDLLQAGQCGRCVGAETGQAGRVCAHCKFDEIQIGWELRLFSLQAHSLSKSKTSVSAEDAVRKVVAVQCPFARTLLQR